MTFLPIGFLRVTVARPDDSAAVFAGDSNASACLRSSEMFLIGQAQRLNAIPNLISGAAGICRRSAVIRIIALADAAAQDAARASCSVTVHKTPEQDRKQVEETYRSLGRDADPSEPH